MPSLALPPALQIASRTSRYLLTAHFSSPIPLERRSTETVVPITSFGVVPSNRKQKNSELAQARRTNLGDECHVVGLWRHHPTDAGARRYWIVVVGPDIGLAPSAGCTSASTLYVFDCLGGVEAFYRQCRFMVTGPVAFTLAPTIDEELSNAVRSNRLYCDGLSVHRGTEPSKKMAQKANTTIPIYN